VISSYHYSSLFGQYLGQGSPSGASGEFRFVCPFCHDREKTFAVNFIRKRFICFRATCGVRGGLSYLADRLGFTLAETPLLSSTDQLRNRLWMLDEPSSVFEVSPKIEEPVPHLDFIQIEPSMFAWDYLRFRGLTAEDIYFNELSLTKEDRGRRIYFPQRDSCGNLVYWVARKYLPGHTKGRKYVNPPCSIKRRLLYRSHLVDRNQPVSVVEGPISAIIAGNAVATLGVLFSSEQVAEIAKLECPILSAMDGEAFTDSVKLARKLEPFGVLAKIVPLPKGKDPADVGRSGFLEYVQKAFSLEPGSVNYMRERLVRTW